MFRLIPAGLMILCVALEEPDEAVTGMAGNDFGY